MDLKDIVLDKSGFPDEIAKFLGNAVAFDSSCESGALTLYIEKDGGYFLKIADKGSLKDEAIRIILAKNRINRRHKGESKSYGRVAVKIHEHYRFKNSD